MNKDCFYTVQTGSRVDGLKYNITVKIGRYSDYFMDWWRSVKSGEAQPVYVVQWCPRGSAYNFITAKLGYFLAVRSKSSLFHTKIKLNLLSDNYECIEYSLDSFERFFILRRKRPAGFTLQVTVKV